MKGPCDNCGSSDGNHTYPEGNSYCFVCKASTPAPGGAPRSAPKAERTKGLIEVEVQAIPKRKIGEEAAQKFGYGYGEYEGRKCQVATYRHPKTGRPIAQKLRFAGKDFKVLGNAKAMPLFGAHLWAGGGRSITITEGEIDALSVSQAWDNKFPVVSIPNGAGGAPEAVKGALEFLETFEKVVLMFDQDEEGAKYALECAALLSPGKAFIATLPQGAKDANDLTMAGRSAEIVKAFWEAKPWRPDELVTVDDVWRRLLEQGSTVGLPVPHAGLMRALRGLRPAEITVLLAATGAGKSTVCREWATGLALAGHKVGYVGLEEGVTRSLVGLLSVAVSRPLHLEESPDLKATDVVAAYEALRQNVVFYDAFGSLDPDHLIGKMRFMAKGEGCKVLFLDHLSILTSGGELALDERRVLDRTMTRLASFVQETKTHVVAVAHLSRREGTPHEEGRRVNLADIRGTHGIAQLAHNVVAIEREQNGDQPNVSTVRVLKNRYAGLTGAVGELEYNTTTGRQLERVGQFEAAPLSPFDDAPLA